MLLVLEGSNATKSLKSGGESTLPKPGKYIHLKRDADILQVLKLKFLLKAYMRKYICWTGAFQIYVLTAKGRKILP